MSAATPLISEQGFDPNNGGRSGAAKVMVVVTDGESHDVDSRDDVIAQCENKGITRFGIAVSNDAFVYTHDASECCNFAQIHRVALRIRLFA